jgi:hypothetical protein
MPIRTTCPSCKAELNVPDTAQGKKVRCPHCQEISPVAARNPPAVLRERQDEAIARQPRAKSHSGSMQKAIPPRISDVAGRAAPRAGGEREAPSSSGISLMLVLLGLGAALFGLFIVVGGGLLMWFLLRSSPSLPVLPPPAEAVVAVEERPAAAVQAAPAVAPANERPAIPGAEAARLMPEAPAVADGEEQFFDLPERNAAEGAADAGPPPVPGNPPPVVPGAKVRVTLSNGRAGRMIGRPGTTFEVSYRFEQGSPTMAGVRYSWVIVTARGRSFKQTLSAAVLRAEGTLQGQALGSLWADAPYRTFLVIERLVPGSGWQEERISDVLVIH